MASAGLPQRREALGCPKWGYDIYNTASRTNPLDAPTKATQGRLMSIDTTKMTEEQLKEIKRKANEALGTYQSGGSSPSAGFDILRYAKAGLYEVRYCGDD